MEQLSSPMPPATCNIATCCTSNINMLQMIFQQNHIDRSNQIIIETKSDAMLPL